MKKIVDIITKCFSPWLLTLLFVAVNLYLNWNVFPKYPIGAHAWAQSDYYAMAQKFYLETWNLFEPQTWIFNKQMAWEWAHVSSDTIISGNIAIHSYIVGMIMRLFGTDAPIIYRIYTFLWIIPFFYFFLKACNIIGVNRGIQVFLGSVFAFSPLFIFYSATSMASVPCIAHMMIGIYFYIKFLYSKDRRDWVWAVVILGVLPLIRTTFVIPFIAVICTEILKWMCRTISVKELGRQMWVVLPFVALFFLWFFWSKEMLAKHNSIFLTSLRSPSSFQEAKEVYRMSIDYWGRHYMIHYHFWILVIFTGVGILFNRKKLLRFDVAFGVILFLGFVCFALAMMTQYKDHDYYYLDSFFLPIVLVTTVIYGNLWQHFKGEFLFVLLALYSSYRSFLQARDYHNWRYNMEYWDGLNHLNFEYKGIDKYLDTIGVTKDKKIVVLSQSAPNRNFTFIKRNGVCAFNSGTTLFETTDFNTFPYFLVTKTEMKEYYEAILHRLKPIGCYGEVLVLTENKNDEMSLEELNAYK